MRKLLIIVSSLTLVFVLLMSMSMPVMAAKPEEKNDNKPVAWVNGASCSNNGLLPVVILSSAISVKYLSDGTTVGKVVARIQYRDVPLPDMISKSKTFDQDETYWWRVGDSKYFQFVLIDSTGVMYRLTLVDAGEGKNSAPDKIFWEVNVGSPAVPDWESFFGNPEPLPVPNGNNQIHLPDYDKLPVP